ncbi:MAG: formimidoylglutamase [Flavobacteriaceae bacterium]|nr:formimidoylglutamase [Bacteroidia bacterium]NNK83183.1 formimidoylglutamase [Flavobacteriaceae bacterium]
MDKIILFKSSDKKKIVNSRAGETKFGEHVKHLTNSRNIYEQLVKIDVDYVIFGIPEDIGVFANYGNIGTSSAYNEVIKVLLNTQNNNYNKAEKVLILGYLDFSKEQKVLASLDQTKISHIKKVRKLVEEIDKSVTKLVHDIIKAGKTPIVIGGGHNNAYGNIKGTALALNQKINAINFDAHTDFRKEEGRHSGNGFSYAFAEEFLDKYFIFGIHENYASQIIINKIKKLKKYVRYNTYESIAIRHELKFKKEIQNALSFVYNQPYGIEIDCDAIEGIASSAMTPTGFSTNKTREFVYTVSAHKNAKYLHICEAAPSLEGKKRRKQTAKIVSYLITDFLRAHKK